MSTHLVHSIRFFTTLPAAENAVRYTQDLNRWTKVTFADILEEVLNEKDKDNEYLFIDRLEFDIKDSPWMLSDEIWKSKVRESLHRASVSSDAHSVILNQWISFLKTGTVQHKAVIKNVTSFEQYLMKRIDRLTTDEFTIIFTAFQSDVSVRRLFHQHSEFFIHQLLLRLFDMDKEILAPVYKLLISSLSYPIENIRRFFETLLAFKSQGNEQALKALPMEALKLNTLNLPELSKIPNKESAKNNQAVSNEFTEDSFLHCANAGLILLAPFLTNLFNHIGLAMDKDDDITYQKAIFLLHYLCTGQQQADESELLLPKILCGLESDYITARSIPLEENFILEANELITSAIEHWDILKNTSIDSFRATFLNREGRLKETTLQYLLQVNESGTDILLSHLPWGFRYTQLPWMEKPIITEWQ